MIETLHVLLPKPCGCSTPRTPMPRRAYVDTSSRDVILGSLDSAHTYASALAYVDTILIDVRLGDVNWKENSK